MSLASATAPSCHQRDCQHEIARNTDSTVDWLYIFRLRNVLCNRTFYTKLSYRKDGACRWSLRCLRSSTITNFEFWRQSISRMRFYISDWIILTFSLSRVVFQLSCSICKVIIFCKGVPLVNALVLGNFFEYCINHILAKTRFFGLHFCCEQYGSIFNNDNALSVTTQSNGHYAVQGHSRSPILAPIDKSYASSC